MTENQKEEILRSYYYTDVEPTLDRLIEVKDIVTSFEKEGANRLQYALNMKHINEEEVERFASYISNARIKMEKELDRLRDFEVHFNEDFATDHNDYYNSVEGILRHIRSHMSPLKNVLRKFCPRRHPTVPQCVRYGIQQKSVFEGSVLGNGDYANPIFDISSYPPAVKGLYTELRKFFDAEKTCMQICIDIIEEEREIRQDPERCKYLLDIYRQKSYQRFKNVMKAFSEDLINQFKSLTPAYKNYQNYESEATFAQGEYHKHNHADMEHFFIIEGFMASNDLTTTEKALWGYDKKIKRVRYVVSNFDDLLPADFNHKDMGLYEYMFCQWALPSNIKQAVEYFIQHYHGKHKVVKYAAANKRSSQYDKNSEKAKNFFSNINRLFQDSNDEDLMGDVS